MHDKFSNRIATITCQFIIFVFLSFSTGNAQEALEDEVAPLGNVAESHNEGLTKDLEQEADPAIENPNGDLHVSIIPTMRSMQMGAERLHVYLTSQGDDVNPLALRRCQDVIDGLKKACLSRSYVDVIALAELSDKAWPAELWQNSSEPIFDHDELGFLLHYCMEQYILKSNGIIPDDIAAKFAVISASKIPWESEGISPKTKIGSGDVFVCNPAATMEALKERTTEEIVRVVKNANTPDDQIYGPNGSAMPLLKTRYAANRELILSKRKELQQALIALEAPPASGEISKTHLHTLRNESRQLERLIELVENGTNAKNSPLFPKLKAYKAALDKLISSMRIEDVKDLILAADPFEAEWEKIETIEQGPGDDETKKAAVAALGIPKFLYEVERLSPDIHFGRILSRDKPPFDVLILDLHSDYLEAFVDNLPPELFEFEFRKTTIKNYMLNENSADLFVLYPDQMVTKVKSLPTAERKRILLDRGTLMDTPEKFFADFTLRPEWHAKFLIARYQNHKAEMDAKYKELVQWHTEQVKEESRNSVPK